MTLYKHENKLDKTSSCPLKTTTVVFFPQAVCKYSAALF